MLPDELLLKTLDDRFPCRETQIRQLKSLYEPTLPSPPTLVIHGLAATAKTSLTRALLRAQRIPHAIVSCAECITARHLLERTVAACLDAVAAAAREDGAEDGIEWGGYTRTENLGMLVVSLGRLLEGRGRFVVVFDGVDGPGGREGWGGTGSGTGTGTVVEALGRLGEVIPNLSTILIVTVPRPRFLHATGVPYVHFPSYTRDQAIHILSRSPPAIFTSPPSPSDDYTADDVAADNAWVWSRYLGVVWDSLAKGAARDVVSFGAVAHRLWREFVKPIEEGSFGTRDFARLVVSRKGLLQGDAALVDSVVVADEGAGEGGRAVLKEAHDLPYYSKFLLCAAYLASYNPARQDSQYFMRASEKKRRRRGGAAAAGGRIAKNRKIPRHLLTPSPFTLDRLLAIFQAILPDPVPQTADIATQLATLSSLRLLLRTGAAGADPLDGGCKWRVGGFGAEYVAALGRSVGFEIVEWLAAGEV